ncbi:MAG: thermonuclease family protein [Chloroflexota bacterium]|nr:thermonuclease family protein [Chloroflexota bacterium]
MQVLKGLLLRNQALSAAMIALGVLVAVACSASDGAAVTRTATLAGGATATASSGATTPTHACSAPYPTGAVTAASVFCADPATLTAARVIRIVDGDTLHVELNGRDETVRLYGINATEVGQPCSAEATARLKELAGTQVLLRPDARDRDRYGRLLRYIYSASGLSIDAELVDEGLAHAWRTDGDLRFAIIELEARAVAAHRGCIAS